MTIRKAMFAAALGITLIAPYPKRVDAATSAAETHVNAAVAPQFSAKSVQGALLSSQKLAGKAYIVNFFGSWCPY
ncbi:MAG: TlpA family protein disulfide reductase, partial [Pelodictyon phaeoclathratiforme]